jgi:predicted ATPase
MIRKYKIENFKSYAVADVDLRMANIVLGLNSSGKSALIQPLLVVAQSGLMGALAMGRIALNGPFVNIGTGQDLMFEFADNETTSITWDKSAITVPYQVDASEPDISAVGITNREQPLGSITYISNARLAPQVLYGRYNDFEVASPIAGVHGENAPGYLANHGNSVPGDGYSNRSREATGSLLERVTYWMGQISPGVGLNIDEFNQFSNLSLRYVFDGKATLSTRPYRAANVGFGLSHSLSIVVALLASPKGALLVVEGPEANLHPRAQRRLGELIGRAAGDGVQVIVETHSPHLVRGVRASVVEGALAPKDLKVLYVQRKAAQSEVTAVAVDGGGNFDEDELAPVLLEFGTEFQDL